MREMGRQVSLPTLGWKESPAMLVKMQTPEPHSRDSDRGSERGAGILLF